MCACSSQVGKLVSATPELERASLSGSDDSTTRRLDTIVEQGESQCTPVPDEALRARAPTAALKVAAEEAHSKPFPRAAPATTSAILAARRAAGPRRRSRAARRAALRDSGEQHIYGTAGAPNGAAALGAPPRAASRHHGPYAAALPSLALDTADALEDLEHPDPDETDQPSMAPRTTVEPADATSRASARALSPADLKPPAEPTSGASEHPPVSAAAPAMGDSAPEAGTHAPVPDGLTFEAAKHLHEQLNQDDQFFLSPPLGAGGLFGIPGLLQSPVGSPRASATWPVSDRSALSVSVRSLLSGLACPHSLCVTVMQNPQAAPRDVTAAGV